MSRIPVPSHSNPQRNLGPPSPVPFPGPNSDRSPSPLPSRFNHGQNGSVSMSSLSGFQSETRKKQSKRDEAIRKKIESELARKRTISTTQHQRSSKRGNRSNAQKGTVAALKPAPALTVPENITVAEASQLCAAKRTDCVLVVDDDEGLSGIFTAKDLAYRVTADGLDPHLTPVHQIMTRNPMVTQSTTSATEALQLMVSKHFRHLPVCNEEGNVVGLLDITKVFHEALGKVERSSAASEQLFSAMAGVQSELGSVTSNPQAVAMLAWAEKLREKTALPDLTSLMDSRTQPAMVGPKTTVREVAKLMKERKTTAVCVMENGLGPNMPSKIAGIFTSKDVVLRVIAAGLDAERCSVVRVMTPHPDTAVPTLTVHDALKKMHNGHYLNLPVVEADGRLVAIIDVLKLTYATLEQMNSMGAEGGPTDAEGGPMWGRFFDSFEDSESALSGSRVRNAPSMGSLSHLMPRSPQSEVHPNDSASVIDDEPSVLEEYSRKKNAAQASAPGPLPVDDGTYVFKFRTPSGRTHRFQARHDDIAHLREVVSGKLATDPFFTEFSATEGSDIRPDPIDFQLLYTDTDGDTVLITSDHDVTDAVKIARASNSDRVVLFVQGGKGWDEAGAGNVDAKAAEVAAAAAAAQEIVELEQSEGFTKEAVPPVPASFDQVMGIPRDLLLPASIGALAIAIIGVFTISRLTASQY
ncbi:CBS and PB1 domain-containing protein [Guyanagaster necrorhizus]|uniref:CBS and PB1 domain-containing protein n=1 Tax=Guyanagaster necrorhizus TaxID=856835 RepID=A0A9P7W145_9AGAR|nr:CBS and PB1 domain-containing protein [Guyanagaster necrorhizus MCA 3950]KAG7450267.1 CBS and PB1 domain-containing protein [Guyanagaster necrorhizus MCA 3950]